MAENVSAAWWSAVPASWNCGRKMKMEMNYNKTRNALGHRLGRCAWGEVAHF
jgi:hypothetical protein